MNRVSLVTRVCVVVFFASLAAAQTVPAQFLQALHWRLIGPFRGGRSVAAVGVPGDPNVYYMGSVGGGVWKSIDAGQTWTPVFDSQNIASIGAIAVAPSDANVIYVGTGESDIRSTLSSGNGVYKSTDAGKTWKNIVLRDSRQISKVVVDPTNAEIVYVAALGHAYGPNDERGVFKSIDGGTTWKRVLDKGPDIGASDLAIAIGNPKVLFAAMWNTRRPPWSTYAPIDGQGSGLYRSTDGGETWTELKGNGLPGGQWGRVGVDVAPDGRRVYAIIDTKPGAGLYRSDDGGNTWVLANGDPRLTSRAWYFDWVTIDPSNPDVVYVPNVALYRSDDAGKSITIVRGAPGGDDYHSLWVDSKNSQHLALATDQGTSISLNRGVTWSSWYNQPTAQMYRIATDNSFPYWVLGSQQDSGSIAVHSRSDHGVLSSQDMIPIGGGESAALAPDPTDSNIIYATGQYGPATRYDRRTSLSQDISPWPMPMWGTDIIDRKYRAPWTPPLVFSPVDKKTLYMGTQYVMKTTDGGLHWQQISPDLTGAKPGSNSAEPTKPTVENAEKLGYGVVYTVAPSPLNENVIWAGSDTGLIHLTTDGGKTWRNVTPPELSDWSKISTIEASRFTAGEAYAAVDRHRLDDPRPYIYRTRDFGKTWQPITKGIGETSFTRVVREDPRKQGLLFAGTELGVYVSFDDGDDWQPLQFNLPVTSVQDLKVHDDDLIAATHGRSIWIMDDITPLRQMNSAAITSNVKLFAPAEAYRIDNDAFLGTPLPPEEPQAKNPPDGAVVDYYLKSNATNVKLEIFDSSNHLVRRYTNEDKPPRRMRLPIAERWFPKPVRLETSAGMHRFVWDLRYASSGRSDAEDASDESTPPKGPRVVPGVYELRLTVDGQTQTQRITVKMDPRANSTAAVLAQQYQVGVEIYQSTMQSRRVLSEAKSVQKKLDEMNAQLAGHPELLARVTTFRTALQKLLDEDKHAGIVGLNSANAGMATALKVVESGDRAIPQSALDVYKMSKAAFDSSAAEWTRMKSSDLEELNQALEKAGLAPVKMVEIEQEIEYLMTR